MRRMTQRCMGIAWLAGALLVSTAANAQQRAQNIPQRNQAYDVSRETVLEGKVIQYTQASTVAPLGPHVTVQTASGVVDVHLGNARMLEANHFSLASGDSIRIVGENVAFGTGTQFLARVLQKGNQTLAIRSTRGFPLAPSGKAGQPVPGGAL